MKIPGLYIALSLLLVSINHLTSHAQEVRSVRLAQYNQNDGLSSDFVTKILKDQHGFLWAGTQEGLNVFDGQVFKHFSNQSPLKHNISGSYVQDLSEDYKRSTLWVQTSYTDISALNLNSRTITHRISKDHLGRDFSEIWARCIHLQNDVLWIGGLNVLSAYDIEDQSFLDVTEIETYLIDKGEYNVFEIISDSFDQTWLLNEGQGVVVLDSSMNIKKSFDLKEFASEEKQKVLFRDAVAFKNDVYVASSWGLIHFRTGTSREEPSLELDVPHILRESEIRSLEIVSDSILLVASTTDLYSLNTKSGETTKIVNENYERLNGTFQVKYDQASNLVWIGSQSGLSSFLMSDGPFTAFSRSSKSSQKIEHLYSLLPVSENLVYAGGGNGIYSINTHSKVIDLIDTASTNLVLFQDQKKNVYASNSSGFHLIEGNKVKSSNLLNPALKSLERDHFNCALQYNDSLILLSSIFQKGLTVWNTNQNVITTFHNDSANYQIPELRVINFLYKNMNDDVLILTEKSIIQFDPITNVHSTQVLRDPRSNKTITNFMDMCETNDGYLLGTYGDGIIETDKKFNVTNLYTTNHGLSNNCVYRIFNINNQLVLATSNNGLSILDRSTKEIKTYFQEDGLHGNGFEQLCGFQQGKNIFAGGSGGFTIVNTDLLPAKRNIPKLYLTGIEIDSKSGQTDSCNLYMTRYSIPNDAVRTKVSFVTPEYKKPDRISYLYKIKELSNDWVNLGNQNFVDLIGIGPGIYSLEIKALNTEGIETIPRQIELEFLPKWYQTLWFKLLILLVTGTLIYLLQRYRITQIHKQQQIRKEIANDLHDDLGSTLNSVKIFTHLAQYEPTNNQHLTQIEESITQATGGLRDMLWVLDDDQDSAYELVERIKKFALPICQANHIEFKTNINANTDQLISKNVKRNLLLISKEAINNSIKYASCTEIQITLEHSRNKLRLKVEDNGKGFDQDTVVYGKGLESMAYRAKQIQFDYTVVSKEGNGTKIKLSNH